jgi:DNA modification methylase
VSRLTVIHGDCLVELKKLAAESVQCCVTSPPYYGLRSYLPNDSPLKASEIGCEETPEAYVAALVAVFREMRRVLKPDGVLWLNLGDSYAGGGNGGGGSFAKDGIRHAEPGTDKNKAMRYGKRGAGNGIKPKDLIGTPWMVAFALRADGWWLRSDVIWAKPNCMPESVTDRPTRSHEYLFLLSKSATYFYDHEAIKEPCIYDVNGTGTAARKARAEGNKLMPTEKVNGIRPGGHKNSVNFNGKNKGAEKQRGHSRRHDGFNDRWDAMEKEEQCTGMRNKRDVWTIAPANYPEAHFATFPADLIKPCILAGSRIGDTVLDPFGGSGTTGAVANGLSRDAILIELADHYLPLIAERTGTTEGHLNLFPARSELSSAPSPAVMDSAEPETLAPAPCGAGSAPEITP